MEINPSQGICIQSLSMSVLKNYVRSICITLTVDSECEAVYFTQFPYVDGFYRAGTPDSLASEETLEKLGEYYVGILSTYTTRRFAP